MRLLFVDCCISQRGQDSRTRRLADAFLNAFRSAHPEAELETVTPETLLALRPFDPEGLNERDALASAGAWDAPVFALARQFRAADAVVVAAPFWDLSYPAALRTYIEHISANGLSYHYDEAVIHWRQLAAMFGIPRFEYVFAGGLDACPEKGEETLAAACELAGKLAAEF